MTESPQTVEPDEPVVKAFASLAERGYRHFPVVDAGRVVGVVSLRDLMRLARIEPVTAPGTLEAPKGLAGVIVAETEVGDVRGQEGFYHYRQYSATELTETPTPRGRLVPALRGRAAHRRPARRPSSTRYGPLREIPEAVRPLLAAVARAGDDFVPLDGLRSAMSLVAQSAWLQALPRHRCGRAAGQRHAGVRRHPHAHRGAVASASGPRGRRPPPTTSATPPTTST